MTESTTEKVIFALVRKEGQSYTELLKMADTNHNSLAKVLKELKKNNIIVQDEYKKYWFSTKIQNRTLKSLGFSYDFAHSFDSFANSLSDSDNPFPMAKNMLGRIFRFQAILRIERFSSQKLSKREILEFDLYFDLFDAAIRWIFEILLKKNSVKVKKLKNDMIHQLS